MVNGKSLELSTMYCDRVQVLRIDVYCAFVARPRRYVSSQALAAVRNRRHSHCGIVGRGQSAPQRGKNEGRETT